LAEVLVVGAGPVGLTLGAELARHGVRSRIIDRMTQPSPYCRAIGVSPRTLEIWEDMGLAREAIDAGLWIRGFRTIIQGGPSADAVADLSDLPYATLGLPQYETERLLAGHLEQFGLGVERGVALTALSQESTRVTVQLTHANGAIEQATFRYVIGCDGAHSAVRHALGIAFEGDAFPMAFMLGDVQIAWDLPYGMALRALRLHEDAPPDLFVAVPLPAVGRYRVSMIAPQALAPPGGTEHGLQAELPGPQLADLQAVADDLLPEKPRLSDLRWSSIFHISMRLAQRYREGRVFIAGDAAHIHPPTGGQGMNTGIQDAYNLAWKLALVLDGRAPEALLESYEAERRPVGADVVARTRAASENFGREGGGKPDRLADTQIRVSYRGTQWVSDDNPTAAAPSAGDRSPDAGGLRRHGIGFPIRLFEVLRGIEHVIVAQLLDGNASGKLADFADFGNDIQAQRRFPLRPIAIVSAADPAAEWPGLALFRDENGAFAEAYGGRNACLLIRPDGYIGWRGPSWRHAGLPSYFDRVFGSLA
jgi:2-polyprenyl-6-methoxyphenol hydroxylase-like FAD-dependent oxidoreductase